MKKKTISVERDVAKAMARYFTISLIVCYVKLRSSSLIFFFGLREELLAWVNICRSFTFCKVLNKTQEA